MKRAGVPLGALAVLGGCTSWLPDSATPQNQSRLYGAFYNSNDQENGARSDELARRLELCGRQLYIKKNGLFGALAQQREHGGGETTLVELIPLFTEDACGTS